MLVQMYRQLMMPINARHFWNEDVGEGERAAVGAAYAVRVRGREGEAEAMRGVVQVDWLGEKIVLEGLVRGKGGMWEIKTRRVM